METQDVGEKPGTKEQLWTVAGLAHYLGVPVATVYRWRHIGTGPRGIRVGKHVRFDPREVERWIAQQTDPRSKRQADPQPAA
jgi:excisionase family DNA binding protein